MIVVYIPVLLAGLFLAVVAASTLIQ